MAVNIGPQDKASHDDWISVLIVLVGILLFAIVLFAAATAGYAGSGRAGYDSDMWSTWGAGPGWGGEETDR